MADLPPPELIFDNGCPDCGRRRVTLTEPPPEAGDDFNWLTRTYDEFREVMIEELAARFPERKRWNAADIEVVIIEALAAVLDQLADMNDRVTAEQYLETARRPENVFRLLTLIGYDPAEAGGFVDEPSNPARRQCIEHWKNEPAAMESARFRGPLEITTQRRMVTLEDYAVRINEHPLVLRAHAWIRWGGSWPVAHVAVMLWNNRMLDEPDDPGLFTEEIMEKVDAFHAARGLRLPDWSGRPAIRTILRMYIDAWRMIGQEVALNDARPIGIALALSIGVREEYFRTEVRHAVERALGTLPGGFFEPGRLKFGEDIYASDIYQTVMNLDGVETVCLNRLKRVGTRSADQTARGFISLDGIEIAVCDNDFTDPKRGYFTLTLHGGRSG